MKRILTIVAGLLAASASAQYAVSWYKVTGGGGTVSNGQYTVGGTIGQHDAGGPFTSGNYSLTGGFWYATAVQTPSAPWLRLFLTTSNTVVVAWPTSSANFRLQQTTGVNPASWSTVTNLVNVVNGENQVTITPLVANAFYRLIYP
jgi:hypothetical protein